MLQNCMNLQAEASNIMLQAVTNITDQSQQKIAKVGEETTETYNMTSGLFPCICVAMYYTLLSPMCFEESLNEGEDEFYYNTVDTDDWKTELVKVAQEYLDDEVIESLRNYGLENIEAASIWSPKYYNYNQDELIMNVTMQKDWQAIMQQKTEEWKDRKDVREYIHDHWRSCSGYINFMPESLQEVLTEENEERQLAAYLTLAMLVEGSLRHAGDIMEDLYYRMEGFSDYERVNVVEEYYDDEEDAMNLLKLWENDFEWNELYWSLCDKIGCPWLHDKECESLDGKKDSCFSWNADSEGKKMLFWAIKKGMTIKDLQEMAA